MAKKKAEDSHSPTFPISRRSFVKITGLSSLGVYIGCEQGIGFSDDGDLEDDVANSFKHFSYACVYTRASDLLNLHFYFVNIKRSGSHLVKIERGHPGYMVVRLPQQHVGEEVLEDKDEHKIINEAKAFVSGFSYLTFELSEDTNRFPFTTKFLLNWNQFKIITHHEAKNFPEKIAVLDPDSYPFNARSDAYTTEEDWLPIFLKTSLGALVPVTHFDMPYKMLLAPTIHDSPDPEDQSLKFIFDTNNDPRIFLQNEGDDVNTELRELWSNNLNHQVMNLDGEVRKESASFKIIGYAGKDKKVDDNRDNPQNGDHFTSLLPAPPHRQHLAELTRIEGEEAAGGKRNIKSKYFNFSGLGANTFLNYYNLDPKDQVIVSWKQEIKLGRDNYVEITFRAVDANSGLKLLVSILAERRIEDGISFLKKRYYFKYQEKGKKYYDPKSINRTTISEIYPMEEGAFFTPYTKSNDVGSFYVALREGSPTADATYQDHMPKFKYRAIDPQGNEHFISKEVIFIPAEVYKITNGTFKYRGLKIVDGEEMDDHANYTNKNVPLQHLDQLDGNDPDYTYRIQPFEEYAKQAAVGVNLFKAAKPESHGIKFEKKLAFTTSPDLEDQKAIVKSNTVLQTKSVHTYTRYFDNGKFADPNPVYPALFYAEAFIPQLDGIESESTVHNVMFSKKFVENGFGENNPTNIFLNLLDPDFSGTSITDEFDDELADDGGDFLSKLVKHRRPAKNLFTENYKNIGSIVNPDVEIESISFEEQGLVMKEKFDQIASFNPLDILGGDAEIVGGIKLREILLTALGIESLPVMKAIDDTKKELRDLEKIFVKNKRFYDALKVDYNRKKDAVAKKLNRLKTLEQRLKSISLKALANYVQKKIENDAFISQVREQVDTIEANKKLIQAKLDQTKAIYTKLHEKTKTKVTSINTWFSTAQINNIKTRLDASITSLAANDLAAYNANHKQLKDEIKGFSSTLRSEVQRYSSLPKKQLEEIKEATRILYMNAFISILFKANNQMRNLKPLIDAYNELKGEVETQIEKEFLLLIKTLNDVHNLSEKYYEKLQEKAELELKILEKQYSETKKLVTDELEKELKKTIAATKVLETVQVYVTTYQAIEAEIQYAKKISREFNVNLTAQIVQFETNLNTLRDKLAGKLKSKIVTVVDELKAQINDEDFRRQLDSYKEKVSQFENEVISNVKLYKERTEQIKADLNSQISLLDNAVNRKVEVLTSAINGTKNELKVVENELESFATDKIRELELEARKLSDDLKEAIEQNLPQVKEIKEKLDDVNAALTAFKTPFKKSISYDWKTEDFKNFDAGIVKFIRRSNPPTSLLVDFKASTEFRISLGEKPIENKQELRVENRLNNFGVSFLDLLTVNFNELKYINGIGVKEDFSVKIKDVQFDGALNFIEVFQRWLKSIDKNFIMEISSKGAELGYLVPLPNIGFGYINFLNLKLNLSVFLPFLPGTPLLLKFGLNNFRDRFKVVVNGFPGRGFFMITVEPKRGVVGLAFLIEFGAHFYFNIGVAAGHAYLYAGIYYRKYYDNVTIKGYILCGGHFRIIGLFNSSLFFHLILTGNGRVIDGEAKLTVSYKFSRWFKISVQIKVYKRIKGAADDSSNKDNSGDLEDVRVNTRNLSLDQDVLDDFINYTLVDTNIKAFDEIESDQELFLVVKSKENSKPKLKITPAADQETESLGKDEFNNEYYFKIIPQFENSGTYSMSMDIGPGPDLNLSQETVVHVIADEEDELADQVTFPRRKEWKEYFFGYYEEI